MHESFEQLITVAALVSEFLASLSLDIISKLSKFQANYPTKIWI